MPIRSIIFWIHLVAGLTAGAVIFIMSATGIAIAFEDEILAWKDRKVSRVEGVVSPDRPALSLAELKRRIEGERPGFQVVSATVLRDPQRAWEFHCDDGTLLYADPRTGTARASVADATHDAIHTLEEWHRWLGAKDGLTSGGRLVTGVCNLAFVVLCVTGLYLWFPRKWSWRSVRSFLVLKRGAKGKARDFNWHVVFGFWSLPVLLVLAVTAVVISFEWGHRLVFTLAGEDAPKSRNYGMMAVPAPPIPTPAENAPRLPLDVLLAHVAEAFPDWRSLAIEEIPDEAGPPVPVEIGVSVPDPMPARAYVPVRVDPYTGGILQAIRFDDRSPGLKARVWARFLHTGGAFGLPGKIVASLATAASLVLVWTGFALSWRRYRAWQGRTDRASST